MKESFARITAWVKSNPWLAAGILAVVAVLAYLSYKNGWFSGAGSSTAAPVDTTGSGTLPTTDSGMPPSGGGITPPVDNTNPVPVPTPATGGANPPSSGYSNSGGGSFTLPPSDNLSNLFGAAPAITTPAGVASTGYVGGLDKSHPVAVGSPISSPTMNAADGIAATGSASIGGKYYDYRDPSTYNLPHNPNGSGRPPKGWTSNTIPTPKQTWVYNPTVAPNPVQQAAFIQQGGYGSSSATTNASIQAAQTGQPAVMHGH